MSDIQDEAYTELCRENARLSARCAFMASNDYVYSLTSEIERLKALLIRAAEALEFWMKDLASTEQQYVDAAMRDERLLAELRKVGASDASGSA